MFIFDIFLTFNIFFSRESLNSLNSLSSRNSLSSGNSLIWKNFLLTLFSTICLFEIWFYSGLKIWHPPFYYWYSWVGSFYFTVAFNRIPTHHLLNLLIRLILWWVFSTCYDNLFFFKLISLLILVLTFILIF